MVDRRRIKNAGLMAGLALFIAAASTVAYYVQRGFPVSDNRNLGSNLGFFVLINLNIIVVMILGFLVVKNVVRLFLDRHQRILGARLRSRLVAAFVGLSLIPTVLLFMVAKGMLERVLQGWFSPQIAASVDGAVSVAKYHYDSAEAQVYRNVHYLSHKLMRLYPYLPGMREGETGEDNEAGKRLLQTYLDEKREEYGLFSIMLLDAQSARVMSAESVQARHKTVETPPPNSAAVYDALKGSVVVRAEQSIDGEFLRGYAPITPSKLDGLVGGIVYRSDPAASAIPAVPSFVLVSTLWVSPELSVSLASVINAYDDYKELRSYRRPLVSSYLLTLIVVTLLVIFGAVWVGFYLARDLSIPIGSLAEGTKQLAHGNLDYRIPEVGDDELSELVRYFNMMTKDLKETTGELVARRRYMEAVLACLGSGLISVDKQGRITTCNIAAADMVGAKTASELLRRDFGEALPGTLAKTIADELEKLYAGPEKLAASNGSLDTPAGLKHIQITLTKLLDEQNASLGAVILLDDITELVSAQRMAAWREVARRIAHEIKNPLTPIQLNAERLQRRFASAKYDAAFTEEDQTVINEATGIMVRQVSILRTLVNEFSNFARMPKSKPRPGSINQLLKEAASVFQEAHPDIAFEPKLDSSVPIFSFDREQMNQVFVNLLNNAVASMTASRANDEETRRDGNLQPRIVIESRYEELLGLVSVSLLDNGSGIKERDKQKIFEPYFTTKPGGTGLGLTIVSTIVEEHNGFIRVRDNYPKGAVFTVELPVNGEALNQATAAQQENN